MKRFWLGLLLSSCVFAQMPETSAIWLGVSSLSCPLGVCTYTDTGSAATGTAPTANTTGQLVGKIQTSSAGDACTAGGIWTDASYIYVCTASGAVEKVAIAP